MYKAELLCEDCGLRRRRDLADTAPADPEDEYSYDSDDYPKGPYPDGGGEADCPQHCGDCGLFLENEVSEHGYGLLAEAIAEDMLRPVAKRGVAFKVWQPFYALTPRMLAPELLARVSSHLAKDWPEAAKALDALADDM